MGLVRIDRLAGDFPAPPKIRNAEPGREPRMSPGVAAEQPVERGEHQAGADRRQEHGRHEIAEPQHLGQSDRRQHQRTVRDRFVARNFDPPVQPGRGLQLPTAHRVLQTRLFAAVPIDTHRPQQQQTETAPDEAENEQHHGNRACVHRLPPGLV